MEKIKKGLRMLIWIMMIVLAGIGIGLCGAVPVPILFKREDSPSNIEMVEEDSKDEDQFELVEKS